MHKLTFTSTTQYALIEGTVVSMLSIVSMLSMLSIRIMYQLKVDVDKLNAVKVVLN